MKSALTAILACLCLFSSVRADEIHVPSNNPSQGRINKFPWFTFNAPEWRYQLLFTAQQLNTSACAITDISFAPSSTGIHVSTKFEMSMSNTTASSLVANWAANMPQPVVVFPEAAYTWQPVRDAWSPIGLKNAFIYDGKGNLVVDLRYFGGKVGGNFDGGCHSDSGTATVILRSWDNRTGAYSGTTAMSFNKIYGLITRFTVNYIYILGSGSPRPGGTVLLQLNGQRDAGLAYQAGSSLGAGPTPLGKRKLNLDLDDMLTVSVGGLLPTIFRNYTGVLDGNGNAQASIMIPSDKALVGIYIHSAFVTLDRNAQLGIKSISETFSFYINP